MELRDSGRKKHVFREKPRIQRSIIKNSDKRAKHIMDTQDHFIRRCTNNGEEKNLKADNDWSTRSKSCLLRTRGMKITA